MYAQSAIIIFFIIVIIIIFFFIVFVVFIIFIIIDLFTITIIGVQHHEITPRHWLTPENLLLSTKITFSITEDPDLCLDWTVFPSGDEGFADQM